MKITTVQDFRQALEAGPCAWPGGYPCYFICEDGGALSYSAAKDNQRLIEDSIITGEKGSGWAVTAYVVNWEDDFLFCSHTNRKIPCAYPTDEVKP